MLVELEVAVALVDRPESGGLHVAQPRDREAGVLADAVPRRSYFDDVDVPVGDVGLDLEFVPQVLGDTLACLSAYAVEIGLGERHQISPA